MFIDSWPEPQRTGTDDAGGGHSIVAKSLRVFGGNFFKIQPIILSYGNFSSLDFSGRGLPVI